MFTYNEKILKSYSHHPKNCFYILQWKPFKNDEKYFYLTLNALFVLEIFTFLFWKLELISKFMTLQTEKQIITTHVLSNISRSKCNQIMKFLWLIDYNRDIYIFLKDHNKIWWRSKSQTLKKSKMSISLVPQSEML